MVQFPEKVEVLDTNSKVVASVNALNGDFLIGGNGKTGNVGLFRSSISTTGIPGSVKSTILMDADQGNIWIGGNGSDGDLVLFPENIQFGINQHARSQYRSLARIHLDGNRGNLWLGGNGNGGDLLIFPSDAKDINNRDLAGVRINGNSGSIALSTQKDFGAELISSIALNAKNSAITVRRVDPSMEMKHFPRIDLNAESGDIDLFNNNGTKSILLDSRRSAMWLGCKDNDGDLLLFSKNATDFRDTSQASVQLNGGTGDIMLRNADCAEEFDISLDSAYVEPGTVMVIGDNGNLQRSEKAYDKRVAGVISGAGDSRPGIILGKKQTQPQNSRLPVALVGRVNCRVDANYSKIEVGDMLATSETPGHAMKATNRFKAFGSVIGKALRTIKSGKSLIPILISLQ